MMIEVTSIKRKYLAIVLLISLVLSMMWMFSGCNRNRKYPTEGVWYCEEYQIQLSFEGTYKNYFTINGKQIECVWNVERGSDWLSLWCMEEDNSDVDYYQTVFLCRFISLTEDELVVRDEAGTRYVFVRVNESEVPIV